MTITFTSTPLHQSHYDQGVARKESMEDKDQLAGPVMSKESYPVSPQGSTYVQTVPLAQPVTSNTGAWTPLSSGSPPLTHGKQYREIAPRRASTSDMVFLSNLSFPRNHVPIAPRLPDDVIMESILGKNQPSLPKTMQDREHRDVLNAALHSIHKASRSYSVVSTASVASTSNSSTVSSVRTSRLRDSHKLAERRRRKEMNGCFESLRTILPRTINLGNGISNLDIPPKNMDSKYDILNRATEYLDRLIATEAFLINERDRLQNILSTQEHIHETQNGLSITDKSLNKDVKK